MKRLILLAALAGVIIPAQVTQKAQPLPTVEPEEGRLPNGKSQREEILKADYAKNLADATELARLASEVKDDIEKNQRWVVSVKTLKKLDDIGRLSHNIHGRLNRY